MVIASISGVRWIPGIEFSIKDLFRLGRSFGEYIGPGVCSIGYDTRSTSLMISKSLVAGLLSKGCTVYNLGLTSTPAVFREVLKCSLDGGLSVTASHNPPDWNGVKFIVRGGRGPFKQELDSILALNSSDSNSFSEITGIVPVEARYPNDVINYIDTTKSSELKIAIDVGGGAGTLLAPKIFRELGLKVYTINSSSGLFSRNLDPTIDNLVGLKKIVQDESADIGAAFDCDADRVVFMDEEGIKLAPDHTLLVYLKYLAEIGQMSDIVISVDTSKAVEDIVKKAGFRVNYSPVGEANVVRKMIQKGISIGGEGSSGGLIISKFNYCRDGVLATAILTKIVEEFGSLKKIVKQFPKYYNLRKKIQCKKDEAEYILKYFEDSESRVDTTDGIKLFRSDGSWILIRPSGTEDIIRLSVEANDEISCSSILSNYAAKISDLIEKVRGK